MSFRADKHNRPSWLGLLILVAIAFVSGRWSGPSSEMFADARAADAVPTPHALPSRVARWHDADMGVTCWQVDGYQQAPAGLACLPDRALEPYMAAELAQLNRLEPVAR